MHRSLTVRAFILVIARTVSAGLGSRRFLRRGTDGIRAAFGVAATSATASGCRWILYGTPGERALKDSRQGFGALLSQTYRRKMMIEWEWRGDLKDDCTAVGHGLMLRAEKMSKKQWWWAVYDNEGQIGCDELAASHDSPPHNAKTGQEARVSAELAALRILYGLQSTENRDLRDFHNMVCNWSRIPAKERFEIMDRCKKYEQPVSGIRK